MRSRRQFQLAGSWSNGDISSGSPWCDVESCGITSMMWVNDFQHPSWNVEGQSRNQSWILLRFLSTYMLIRIQNSEATRAADCLNNKSVQ
mmetsp:Transcript_38085/g.61840  ORF Transcript_38085/g.61840 Transcript_38085/m.61840 type:complete len:90 (-) Transcript_38085:1597-1866(-)